MSLTASVLLVARNVSQFIQPCLRSVLEQTERAFELIIVDDASDDDTIAKARAITGDRATILTNERQRGIAASRNLAARRATGSILVVVDGDDECLPTRLESQLAFLRAHPEVGAVGGFAEAVDAEGRALGLLTSPTDNPSIRASVFSRAPLIHPALAVRKSAFLECGGYREKFVVASDYDLLCRLAEKTQLAAIPKPLCRYRLTPGSISIRHRALQRSAIELARRFARERSANGLDSYQDCPDEAFRPLGVESGSLSSYHLFCGKLAAASGNLSTARAHFMKALDSIETRGQALALLGLSLGGPRVYSIVQQHLGTTPSASD